MVVASDAKRFWDARAREDAFYFVDNRVGYREPDQDAFWADGERDFDALLDAVGAALDPGDRVVEIGCGPGDSLVPMATARPDIDVLAFEVYEPAVAALTSRLLREGVPNVRVAPVDAVAGLGRLVGAGSLAEVWTFFPDPWHKTKHHKRRLVTPTNAALAASRLDPGAVWRLATDWAEYAEQMIEVLDAEPLLTGGRVERWDERPVTRFERKGLEKDRLITDLAYTRL